MSRPRQLSSIEKFAIKGMKDSGKTSDEIAKELDRPRQIVSNYIEQLMANEDVEKAPEPAKPTKPKKAAAKNKSPKAGDFFINKTGSGRKGVVTMTHMAAELSDKAIKSDPAINDRYKNCIFRRDE